jgi:RimJ/RimL family protein N-acetyltransferase
MDAAVDDRDPGAPVPGWTPPPRPDWSVREGRLARLERLDPDRHGAELFAANRASDAIWDYMPYGPFDRRDAYVDWLGWAAGQDDPRFYAIRDRGTGRTAGVASYLRIAPEAGSIEVGHIALSPALQRNPAATEAMALMMGWAFSAGYRRYEWKCNALNRASRRAAERLGLSYEGVFRQAAVIKGRNRDTAWFAAIDAEWPALRAAFDTWLDPANFDAQGRQRRRLSDLTRPILVARDPASAAETSPVRA